MSNSGRLRCLVVTLSLAFLLGESSAPAVVAPTPERAPIGSTHTPALQLPAERPGSATVPLRTKDPSALEQAKKRAEPGSPGAKGAEQFGPSPSTPAFAGLNQPGLSFSTGDLSPPDPTGAIGPSNYIEFVNKHVGVYDRANLSFVAQIDLDNFVHRSGICDPQILWDQQANRWFYAALANCAKAPNASYLMFGWSKTSSPTPLPSATSSGNWCAFEQFTGNDLNDYPKLGHNDNHFIIGTNVFNPPTAPTPVTSRIWMIEKPSAGVTTCTTPPTFLTPASNSTPLTTSDGTTAFTPVPANMTDGGANGYVVAPDFPNTSASQIMTWHVSGGGGGTAPSFTADGNINVTPYSIPLNIPQPGTTNLIDSSDARLTQAIGRADPDAGGAKAIWTQHTINGSGNRSVVRWYELVPALCSGGTCPAGARRQEGAISNASHFAFNGAISPAGSGKDAVIQYNLGSASLLAQLHAQSRQGGLPLGTTEGDTFLGSSAAADQDYTCVVPTGGGNPVCRWGDYAAATPDPTTSDAVWGTNQLLGPASGNSGSWVTRNFSLRIPSGFPRPKGATPTRIALVPAYRQCTSGNTTHPAPLSFASCNPPVQASDNLTVGTLNANGQAANSVGSVRVDSLASGDDSLKVSISDVRTRPFLTDYTGNVQAQIPMRVTDQRNGSSQTESATVSDFVFSFTVPCTPTTADTTIGSTCSINTSANSVLSGTVVSGFRQNIGLGVISIFDGGPDGDVTTANNQVFAWQGLFNP